MGFFRVLAITALTVILLAGCHDETKEFYTTGETVYTAKFVLDFDQDGLAHYPFGPDMDDDNDGLLTRFAGGRDVNDQDPSIGVVGKGNGQFSSPDFYWGNMNYPAWTGFGDFNADGWLDPVVLESGLHTIGVALNRGNKDIGTAIQYGVTESYDDKYPAIGDFDGDGNLDMALVGNATGAKIAWGNGDGRFTHDTVVGGISTSSIIRKMVAVDFDGDGYLDLAATDETNNRITVVFNNGTGTFGSEVHLAVTAAEANSVCGLAFGHLNNDTHFDLITMKNGTGNVPAVSVFLNNGDGTFGAEVATNLSVGVDFGNDIALGDFNEDGKLDLITDSDTTSNLLVALGNNDGTFASGTTIDLKIPSSFDQAAIYNVSDIDGDGHLDAFTTENGFEKMVILRGQGDGTFIVGILSVGLDMNVMGAAIADFNGDGIFDIAFHTREYADPHPGLFVLWGR